MSITGVPSIASNPTRCRSKPLRAIRRHLFVPMKFGLVGEHVANTPRKGLEMSPRG